MKSIKPTCSVGYGCGNSCISGVYVCRGEVPAEFMNRFVEAIELARAFDKNNVPDLSTTPMPAGVDKSAALPESGTKEFDTGESIVVDQGKAKFIDVDGEELVSVDGGAAELAAEFRKRAIDTEIITGETVEDQLKSAGFEFSPDLNEWSKTDEAIMTVANVEEGEVYLQSTLGNDMTTESYWNDNLITSAEQLHDEIDKRLKLD